EVKMSGRHLPIAVDFYGDLAIQFQGHRIAQQGGAADALIFLGAQVDDALVLDRLDDVCCSVGAAIIDGDDVVYKTGKSSDNLAHPCFLVVGWNYHGYSLVFVHGKLEAVTVTFCRKL